LRSQKALQKADRVETLSDTEAELAQQSDTLPDYMAVREALSGICSPVSAEIDQGREERI